MERATRLWGAAAALCATRQTPPPPIAPAQQERDLGAARAALGPEAFTAAWTAGGELSLERALAEAMDEAPCYHWPRDGKGRCFLLYYRHKAD